MVGSTDVLVMAADALAAHAHHRQRRRHGAPYIEHPRAVARLLSSLMPTSAVMVATALCHDVVEDTTITEGILAELHPRLAEGVAWLTKPVHVKDEASTTAYYQHLLAAPAWVRAIKACDRLHNLSELHLSPDAAKLATAEQETTRCILPLLFDLPTLHTLVAAAIDQALFVQGARTRTVSTFPGIYAIVAPVDDDDDELAQRVRTLCIAGVTMVQLRMKQGGDRGKLAALRRVVATATPFGVPVIMNDRADLARIGGAFGVHVGDDDVLPVDAKMAIGDGIVGHSTHTAPQLLAAAAQPSLHHVALGPIFSSITKSGHADVVGIEPLQMACAATAMPVVAIGGIDSEQRVQQVMHAGAHWAAMVSSLLPDAKDAHALYTRARRFVLTAHAARLPAIVLPEMP
jgi:thiamine-phosphate pyrophosphorylase